MKCYGADTCVWALLCFQGNVKDVEDVGGMLVEKLPVFLQSSDLEVQERVCTVGVAYGRGVAECIFMNA